MFKFLKDKLKKAVSIFTKKVEAEAEIKEEENIIEQKAPEVKERPIKEPLKEEEQEEIIEVEVPAEERGWKEKIEETKEIKKEEKEDEEEKEELEEAKEETVEEIEEKKEPEGVIEEIISEVKEDIGEIKEEFEDIEERQAKPKEKQEGKQEKLSFFKKLFGKKEKKGEEREEKTEEIPEIKKEEKEKKEEAEAIKKEIVEERKPKERKEVKPKALVREEAKPEIKVKKEEEREEKTEEEEKEPEEKSGFFKRIKETFTTVKLSEEKFESLFWDLEVVLMENNVAVEVIEKIKEDLKRDLTSGKVSRKGVGELIEDSLRNSVQELFIGKHFSLVDEIKKKKEKPYIITFIGVNGSGKTTTMAKMANMLMKNHLSVVFAASDTFRAAAIQQLQEHADRLGVKMIKHDYDSDPTAVAFDAIKHAKAKGIDVVLIDTAGRLHVNDNLMNELKKLVRVNKPDMKIFVGESITGNDCVEQAKVFNEAVGIDAIILAKADVDEKGGAAVSVSYVTQKPIIYLGTGQKYEDLTEFKPEIVIKNIGL